MVLLPCSNCCGPACTCPACSCCTCDSWQRAFDQHARNPDFPYAESYFADIYTDLIDLLPGCISRLYESQAECVNALVAQAMASFPGIPEQEIRNAFQATWEAMECQGTISRVGQTWHGWSVPYINGVVASPATLNAECPAGAPPSSLYCSPGATRYWRVPEYTNSGTPDIRRLVLETPATGDWIADALLARGTQEDLPAAGWIEADDCASCGDPAVLESDCDPATDYKVFYDKVITVRESFPNPCGVDELSLCPPENCKVVNIKVTRTSQCSPHSPASPSVTEWEVEIAVCPCLSPFVLLTPANANSDPIILEAYGYASEQDCINDLTSVNCLGGTPLSRCVADQWKLVRHSIDDGLRQCLTQTCVNTCSSTPGCCT